MEKQSPSASPRKHWLFQTAKVFVVVGLLASAFFISVVVGLQLALKVREVTVPDLVGQPIDAATSFLAEQELHLRLEPLSEINPSVPLNHISSQDPAPGLTTRTQRSVKVWLSSGNRAGSVPMLVGQSETSARRRLNEDSLSLGALAEIHSSLYPSDAIVAQESPAPGTAAEVSVLLNLGERGATYVMPDLIGMRGTIAAEALRGNGFRVTVVGDHPYPDLTPDIVLRQSPQAGFQIALGEAISLEVSR